MGIPRVCSQFSHDDTLPSQDKILQECSNALSCKYLMVRYLARLIGRMSTATQAVLPAPLFYRRLQHLKNDAYKSSQSYETLDQAARQDLHWWLKEVKEWNGRPVQPSPPDIILESDASVLGWGVRMTINILEMLAGTFAIKTLARDRSNIHVCLRMDNTSAVAYVNHMGGTQSSQLSGICGCGDSARE